MILKLWNPGGKPTKWYGRQFWWALHDPDFKELLDISRKHAVELLEYFDSQHLTIRQENQRVPARIMET